MARPTPTCQHAAARCLVACTKCGHRCYEHYTNGCHGGSELEEPCFCAEFKEAEPPAK